MMRNGFVVSVLVGCVCQGNIRAAEATYRLHDGITAFVHNVAGKDFTVTLDVRDVNLFENGPREVLFKAYDPDGRAVVREVIPDDGVTTPAYQPPAGAWDHEAWYYAHARMQGVEPMLRWSAFSAPDRLAAVPKRTFTRAIKGNKKGVYRVLVVGAIDHYVTLKIDPDLPFGVAGHPLFVHGHGDLFRRSYIYVPKGTRGLHVVLAEYDLPRTRRFTLKTADGKTLFEGGAANGFARSAIEFDRPGQHDHQILTLEVSNGPGDFLLGLKLRLEKDPEVTNRGERAVEAVLAPDAKTAKALQGGALYHDGRVFWQPYQIRLHDWLKRLKPEDFVVRDSGGKVIDVLKLPERPGFLNVNDLYWTPPLCDKILHHWPAHKNRAALHLALRDLAAGLRSIGPNDHVAVAVGGPWANMAYEFSNYAWHYWRPAWRILQETDAPAEVKAIVRDAFLSAGDRLAFCRSWERVNGNSFAQVPAALRYCHEATGDPLQKQLFETYWQRFTTGGWGQRVGVGPSGPVQESFGYAYHYASYILGTWKAILADLGDERFQKVYDRIRAWFSYTLADEDIPAGPWCSRTHHYPHWKIEKDGPFAWKGLPGPDFTTSVNDANEWFAARRKGYYALTYHGRLTPKWIGNAFSGQIGYGGGILCQVHVPGKGPVIASTLNGSYGEGMHPSQWRTFRIHAIVGHTADGRPLVSGDSEHLDAKLSGDTVTSSGEVRDSAVQVTLSYTFGADAIACDVRLKETGYQELLELWIKNPMRGQVTEAYEMIPFVAFKPGKKASKKPDDRTQVTALAPDGKSLGLLGKDAVIAQTIVIDRGGFGVRIELEQPRPVLRGQADTVLIQLTQTRTPASKVGVKYRIVPFS